MDITAKLKRLEQLPNAILNKEREMLEKRRDLELAKLKFDVSYSQQLIMAVKPNATEKKAQALITSKKEKEELIEAEMEFKMIEAHFNALNNDFIAIRKLLSVEESLIKSQLSGN